MTIITTAARLRKFFSNPGILLALWCEGAAVGSLVTWVVLR